MKNERKKAPTGIEPGSSGWKTRLITIGPQWLHGSINQSVQHQQYGLRTISVTIKPIIEGARVLLRKTSGMDSGNVNTHLYTQEL